VDIAPTPDNRALAAAVNARIRSESRIINAKAALWRLSGVGILCALIGAGIGAAFYGYSYVGTDRAPRTEQVAQALTQALEKTTLKVEPPVKPEPAEPVTAPIPKPSETQLGTDAAPASRASVATAFTVFKNVPFGSGQVVTGWNFTSGDQPNPNHQYCYYSEQIDGTSKVTIDLGENGHTLPAPTKTRTSVDPARAYANCVWFKSGSL
jgi:hypothetical protein